MDRKQVEDNLILLVLTGSHSYGLALPTSDKDYKGIFIAPKDYYIGMLDIEQKDSGWDEVGNGNFTILDNNKDTVTYELKKYLKLASKCNPNILELLFEDEKYYEYVNPLGRMLIDARELFLSKKVRYTYSGYAHAQIRRIKTHRKWLLEPVKHKPQLEDYGLDHNLVLTKAQHNAFLEYLWTLMKDSIEFFEEEKELYSLINERVDFKGLIYQKPLSEEVKPFVQQLTRSTDEFMSVLTKTQQYNTALHHYKQYQSWQRNRNEARAVLEAKCGYDSKHAAHCIRLLRMGNEILTTGKVQVNREGIDAQELLEIRLGNVAYDDMVQEADKLFKQLDVSYENSQLPQEVDANKINELCIKLVEAKHSATSDLLKKS